MKNKPAITATSVTLLTFLILITFQWGKLTAQNVVINEFMSSNQSTIADEDGDFSDWIEIYNGDINAVNLEGFYLTDNADIPDKWAIPAVTILPGDYLLIWASGKDKTDPASPLHTNFSISAAGEELLLSDTGLILLDSVPATEIETDFSYGRQPDGGSTWFFFGDATPGSSNVTAGYTEFLKRPDFSAEGGFHYNPFDLTISHEDTSVQIIYTLDGSDPDINNLNGVTYHYKNQYPAYPGNPFGPLLTDTFYSHVYENPIPVTDQSNRPNDLSEISTTWHATPTYFPTDTVFKGMVVRARAYKPGAVPSKIKTRTFFVTPEGPAKYSLPVISFTTQENYLFDYDTGLYVAGVDFDNWRTAFPNAWPHGGRPANYQREGDQWEYPAYLEMFEPDEVGSAISQNVGFRMHGAYALANPMKTFRIYARDLYGPSTLHHKIFPDLPYNDYKRILIRNSGQDFFSSMVPNNMPKTMMKDGVLQSLVSGLRFDTQAYRPCIVFINGEYWGIQNIRERYDKHYLERTYGIDPENIDYLEKDGTIIEGDDVFYNEMWDYLENHNFSNQTNFDWMKTRIDMDNFIDYQIANIYFRNLDWPGNNLSFWRLRTPQYDPGAPYGHDGRFRWLMYDLDICISGMWTTESYTYNALERALDSTGTYPGHAEIWATLLLRRMTQNEGFKNEFVNRFADLLNTTFSPENFLGVIQEKKAAIEADIPDMIKRWNYPNDISDWQQNVAVMEEYAQKRPPFQRQHIMEQFGIADTVTLNLDVSDPAHGYIRVNTIDVKTGTAGVGDPAFPWSGIYFEGIPIELEAVPFNGYAFSHWIGTSSAGSSVVTLTPSGDLNITAVFVPTEPSELIYFWLFDNNLPNDLPLESIDATYHLLPGASITYHSALAGYPFYDGHPLWRKASLERRNEPTDLNYRPDGNNNIPYDSVEMRGIQVKQPFMGDGGQNTLYLHLPTTGYENLVLRFAALDEGAADSLLIDYSVTPIQVWKTNGMNQSSFPVAGVYQLYELDFSNIPEVNNNSDFTVRIRFWAPDMTIDNGDRVTFNNFSLDARPFNGATVYYSKSTGELDHLDTWGLHEDGSGDPPLAFSDEHQIFNVCNRDTVILEEDWGVSGIGSRILVGNGADSILFRVPASHNVYGPVDLGAYATIDIANSTIPDLELISKLSTVEFSQTADTTAIPSFTYGNLKLRNAVKQFTDHTILKGNLNIDGAKLEVGENIDEMDLTIGGSLILQNGGLMSDSCYNHLNLLMDSKGDQLLDGDTSLIKCHDMIITKTSGKISFQSDLRTGNHLNAILSGSAQLQDVGHTLTIGNSIEFHGAAANYDLTGTLHFAGNDPAGPGVNNQNIRGADNNHAPLAEFNNIVLSGHDQKRFRPNDTAQDVVIKGDLIIDSTAIDRIRFYENNIHLGGNLVWNSEGSFESDQAAFIFSGDNNQHIDLADTALFRKVTIGKTSGNVLLNGFVTVLDTLKFQSGKIIIADSGLISAGLNGVVEGYNDLRYVVGPFGRYIDNAVLKSFEFPVGKTGDYQPMTLGVSQVAKDTSLIVIELFDAPPPPLSLPPDLDWISDQRYHRLDFYGPGQLDSTIVTLPYDQSEFGFDIGLLRIASNDTTHWVNKGGIATGGPKGAVASQASLTGSALIALARYNDIAPAEQYIELNFFLEGPYDTLLHQMNNTLYQQGLLPLEQPFNKPPWNYSGTESVAAIPDSNCVDWVLVEFRDAPDATTAGSGSVFDRRAGFLLQDGTVADTNGASPLVFTGTGLENLFVVVWHRNHLGVISSTPVVPAEGVYHYDFTSSVSQALGGNNSLIMIENGKWSSISGDFDASGTVDSTDKTAVWQVQAGEKGYLPADSNLDGQVDNRDKNNDWEPNLGKGTQVPD